jgi:hypothetical protein
LVETKGNISETLGDARRDCTHFFRRGRARRALALELNDADPIRACALEAAPDPALRPRVHAPSIRQIRRINAFC